MNVRMRLVEAFRQGLGDPGYVEGHNIVHVIRSAERGPEQPPDCSTELVRQKMGVVFAGGRL